MDTCAVVYIYPPMPDRFRGRCQTKTDTLVLQVERWAWG
jgi:hypothetical protein